MKWANQAYEEHSNAIRSILPKVSTSPLSGSVQRTHNIAPNDNTPPKMEIFRAEGMDLFASRIR